MTTSPKARKFRIRLNDAPSSAPEPGPEPDHDVAPPKAPTGTPAPDAADLMANLTYIEDGFGDLALPGSAAANRGDAISQARKQAPDQAQDQARDQAQGQTDSAPDPAPLADDPIEAALAAIRAEKLTGRQLRVARRLAQKQGLTPTSDFDAVRLLRAQGLNPFGPTNMLDVIAAQARDGAGPQDGTAADNTTANLPATAPPPVQTPAKSAPARPLAADERAAGIIKIQRDIARRRQRRLVLLAARLSFFVLLPTLLVAFHYFKVATPLYATNTEFVIQKAESAGMGSGGGLGGMMGGSGFATVQESIVVQSYLQSREAMLRLDADLDFRGHFSAPHIDPLIRLEPDATVETMYATYLDQLTIGYDPTEGVIKMEMRAADPATSQAFSEALIGYAEERVDQMSRRLRDDQMSGARDSYEDAERRVLEAQTRVLELQERRGVLSAEAEVSAVFQQISSFEMELQNERLRLAEIMAARSPNPTRVAVAENNIARLETLIAGLRSGLTATQSGGASLARIQSELLIAQADLQTRQMMLSQALQQLETARIEANRQSLYLSMGVFPVAPDQAAYPRAFENSLLAFLVFSGIYLMVSMTASILREQVSS